MFKFSRSRLFQSSLSVILSSILIAETPSPDLNYPFTVEDTPLPQVDPSVETPFANPQEIISDYNYDEDTDPPSEEDYTNEDEDGPDTQSSLKKVLYDPKMNYGTGAPAPRPNPMSTVKRNVVAFATSLVLGTIAVLVVSHGQGADAPKN